VHVVIPLHFRFKRALSWLLSTMTMLRLIAQGGSPNVLVAVTANLKSLPAGPRLQVIRGSATGEQKNGYGCYGPSEHLWALIRGNFLSDF
jgi:hypothetical protein